MKRTIAAITLSSLAALAGLPHTATARDTTAAAAPSTAPERTTARIEVCFVLDTTGSMSGLIEGAKRKIWSLANEIAKAEPVPELRVGLVGYRDRGDAYVTRVFALTNDLDAIYGQLQSLEAAGGGDTPESVNEALQAAVNDMPWSPDRRALKIIFLVGDAPPHMDYPGAPRYPEVCQQAVKRDLLINTIQCGTMSQTTPVWKEIASLSEGQFAVIPQSGNMIAIATPVDAKLAELNRQLGGTFIAYGSDGTRDAVARKQAAAECAPASVAADRLAFTSRYGVASTGGGELLDAISTGTVRLETIDRTWLPEDLRGMDDADLKQAIEQRRKTRAELQERIQTLNRQRAAFLAAEQKRLATEGAVDSFDATVAAVIRQQASRKGIQYPDVASK